MTRLLAPRSLLLLAAALLNGCAASGQTPTSAPANATGPAGLERGGPFGTYLSGRFAQSQADTQGAADRLLAVFRQEQDQPEVLARAFTAALLDGRPEAVALARRLPDNQSAQLLLIGAEVEARRFEQAESRIRALPRGGPAQLLQPMLLAWALQGRGQTDAALAVLRPLVETGRLRGLFALQLALLADMANRPREAERAIRAALADGITGAPHTLLLAAGILARAGRAADGEALLADLGAGLSDMAMTVADPAQRQAVMARQIVTTPAQGMVEAHLALVSVLAAARQGGGQAGGPNATEGPLILARLALRLDPENAAALLLLSELYRSARHPATALAVLDGVPAGDPLAPAAVLRRASLLDQLDRTAEAEARLASLADAHPAAPQPRARLGDIRRGRSRFAEAVTAYDAAITRLPSQVPDQAWPLLYARGIAHERSDRWPLAEADFQAALRLAPEQPLVLNYLAYSWVEQRRNLPEARRMLERAVELRPDDGNIVDSLGWALFQMGDIQGAVRWLERAVELEPRNSVINDHLGDAYWAAGRPAEARFQWRRALGQEPEPQEIPKIEAKLRDGLPAAASATARPN
jgi:tetratricopeptide (TPR) repeat protein